MLKPDLIITQHESCDYPIARLFLKRHRDYFGKIIIYFSKHFREPVYTQFLKTVLSPLGNIVFLDPIEYTYGVEDWRNVSTNYMLKHTDSEWVCSVEQDYFCRDWYKLLNSVEKEIDEGDSDLIGWWHEANKYIHPSFWFIKRSVLDKTSKDFSAHGKHDHFGWISEDVIHMGGKIKTIQDMGYVDLVDSFHMGGVNQNYLEGLKPEYTFHRPDWFYIYNYWSRKAMVLHSPEFIDISLKIEARLKGMFPEIDLEHDVRSIYFK